MRAPRKQKLTELLIKRAHAAPGLIWDTKQAGLVLRVQPSGARSWYCVDSRHGRSRWLRLGDVAAIALADARVLAAETMLAVARGGDPAAERRAERSKGTFEELAVRYVETYAKRHNKSWTQADALIRRHVLPRWGKLQAASIARSDVKALMAQIDAPIAANQTLAAISAIFSWGLKEEIVATNPCRGIDRNPTRSRERVLSAGEMPQFWAAFDSAGPVAAAALRAILILGQRPGEIAHMRHEHIKDGWWEMPGEPAPSLGWPGTKNGESHRVWIPAPAQALLGAPDAKGFVFANTRGGGVAKLDKLMRDICKAIGAERATPHDLRRTFSTAVAALGFGRDALNRVTNHKEGGIASVYDRHTYADENRHVMETVAAHIMALAEGRLEDGKVVQMRRR